MDPLRSGMFSDCAGNTKPGILTAHLSFMAGIYISVYKIQDLRWIRKMIIPVFCFIIPYVALRYFLGGDPEVSEGSKLLAT